MTHYIHIETDEKSGEMMALLSQELSVPGVILLFEYHWLASTTAPLLLTIIPVLILTMLNLCLYFVIRGNHNNQALFDFSLFFKNTFLAILLLLVLPWSIQSPVSVGLLCLANFCLALMIGAFYLVGEIQLSIAERMQAKSIPSVQLVIILAFQSILITPVLLALYVHLPMVLTSGFLKISTVLSLASLKLSIINFATVMAISVFQTWLMAFNPLSLDTVGSLISSPMRGFAAPLRNSAEYFSCLMALGVVLSMYCIFPQPLIWAWQVLAVPNLDLQFYILNAVSAILLSCVVMSVANIFVIACRHAFQFVVNLIKPCCPSVFADSKENKRPLPADGLKGNNPDPSANHDLPYKTNINNTDPTLVLD